MKTEVKKQIVGSVATHAAEKAAAQARNASGWKKVLWGLGAAIAAAVAWFCQGATQQQPEPVPPPAAEGTSQP